MRSLMDTLWYVYTYVLVPGMDTLTFYVAQCKGHTLLCPSMDTLKNVWDIIRYDDSGVGLGTWDKITKMK